MPDTPLQRLVDRYHEVYGEGLLIIDADGQTLAARGLGISDPGVAIGRRATPSSTHPRAQWAPIMPWDRALLLSATAVSARTANWSAPSSLRSTPPPRARYRAILVMGGGRLSRRARPGRGVVARALTRWVLRPLDGLERAVAEMTEGIAGPPANVAGPPELRHFTSAFNTMAQVVRASLDRQRRLVADASHQLRNPLAAVRLRADTLAENYVIDRGQSDISAR